MLSATNTIADIKARLENDYLFYGYSSDSVFTSALSMVAEDVYNSYYVPRLGVVEYARIATKNKISLSPNETYLYWAEVFLACYEFLKFKSASQNQLQSGGDETLRVEGYQHSISGGGGSASLGGKAISFYWENAYLYFKKAGFDLMAMMRSCTVFGDGDVTEE
jgi:hypothetical protein